MEADAIVEPAAVARKHDGYAGISVVIEGVPQHCRLERLIHSLFPVVHLITFEELNGHTSFSIRFQTCLNSGGMEPTAIACSIGRFAHATFSRF